MLIGPIFDQKVIIIFAKIEIGQNLNHILTVLRSVYLLPPFALQIAAFVTGLGGTGLQGEWARSDLARRD